MQTGSAEPSRHTQHNTFSWALDGRFLEERGEGTDGSCFLGLWSLHAESGKYHAYYFLAPAGVVVALTHEWDEQRQSFSGSAELGNGLRALAEDRFLGPDTYEWSIAVLSADGSVLTRTHAREQRIPTPAPNRSPPDSGAARSTRTR